MAVVVLLQSILFLSSMYMLYHCPNSHVDEKTLTALMNVTAIKFCGTTFADSRRGRGRVGATRVRLTFQ